MTLHLITQRGKCCEFCGSAAAAIIERGEDFTAIFDEYARSWNRCTLRDFGKNIVALVLAYNIDMRDWRAQYDIQRGMRKVRFVEVAAPVRAVNADAHTPDLHKMLRCGQQCQVWYAEENHQKERGGAKSSRKTARAAKRGS